MVFKKTVVWGCPLHQHTNSYVYAAYYKAFKHMGFDAYWLNSTSDVSGMDFSDTLFFTEGQHDGNIPIRNDCKYILHNCSNPKYKDLNPENKLGLQVYTNDVLIYDTQKVDDGVYVAKGGRGLFQPWATDLLPNEINMAWADIPRKREIHWVGTMGDGLFGNRNEIEAFVKEARKEGISFSCHGPGSTSFEDNLALIQKSFLAPAIHGTWQAKQGYIACRIFKNVSYGHLAATNCKAAADLFQGNVIYAADTAQLFHESKKKTGDKRMILEAMKLVRDKHTYVNRIKQILSMF